MSYKVSARRRTLRAWYLGTLVPWYLGTLVPWYLSNTLLSACCPCFVCQLVCALAQRHDDALLTPASVKCNTRPIKFILSPSTDEQHKDVAIALHLLQLAPRLFFAAVGSIDDVGAVNVLLAQRTSGAQIDTRYAITCHTSS